MRSRFLLPLAALALAALAPALAGCGSAQISTGPAPELRLRRIILYQNGIGYFERTGALREPKLRLRFREREVDDVLKSLVVVEEGLGPNDKPSTVSALLPQQPAGAGERDAEAEAWLDLVLSPRTRRPVSIAYAVPTPAWKSTYRVILPDPGAKNPRALLQAWALVDNVSDEDWNQVRLTLATGAPLSFAADLRTPRFVPRPGAGGAAPGPIATGPVLAERSAGQDRDGDGIPDSTDACPSEPGTSDADGGRNGCPRFARVTVSSSEIRILQQVYFERDSDVLRPEARPLVEEIASVLKQNPQIRKLAVEGHASGGERDPWGLSARRAGAVRAALLARGVSTEITTRSFGETRPLDSNGTEEGRRKNRRVEFHIEETKQPAASAGAVQSKALAGAAAAGVPQELAGTVRYDIAHPISIPRRSSTLVTLINEPVPGEETLLFRPDPAVPASSVHPLRAARLENRGGLALQPGSASIFAGGTFVGEGLIDRLEPGETALIPYALDSSTHVEVGVEEAERPRRILALARGVVTVENTGVLTTRYALRVGRQAPPRMFIRHDRRPGHEATRLPPGTETTAASYLIPLPIQGGRPSELAIEETQPRRREIAVTDIEGPQLGLYLQGSALPPDAEQSVREVIALRTEVGKIQGEMDALRAQLDDAAQRSAELRESLRAIERTPRAAALQKTLLDRLGEATARAETLSAKLADRSAALAEARARLTERLRDLRLEEKRDVREDRK